MQHEAIAYVERVMGGVAVDEERLGVEVVREVGPGGTFLAEMHTVEHFRQELWFPELLDREYWDNWKEKGARTMHDRCVEEKDRLLEAHEVSPLEDDTESEVRRILSAARRQLG